MDTVAIKVRTLGLKTEEIEQRDFYIEKKHKEMLERFRMGSVVAYECKHLIHIYGEQMMYYLIDNGYITEYT